MSFQEKKRRSSVFISFLFFLILFLSLSSVPYAVQRRLLGFLVSRGVTSMKGKLPEASNLRDIYEKVMGSMAGDTHQPLPFLFSFEREEYTRILYNWTLTEFKENVVYRATRHELKLAIQTAITQLDKELGSMSLSDIQQKVQTSLLPKYLREASPARYGWTSDKLNEKIKHITQKAVERQQSISVDMTETVLRVNGRSIPAKRADMKAHSILKKATVFPNDLTCLQLNQFFTNLLKESFDPKCRRFVAQLKRLTRPSPAEYEAVPSNVKLVDLFTSRDKAIFKLVAVSLTDAKTEGATSE
ncbi:protein kinase domain, partial [Cystoisospora suis]